MVKISRRHVDDVEFFWRKQQMQDAHFILPPMKKTCPMVHATTECLNVIDNHSIINIVTGTNCTKSTLLSGKRMVRIGGFIKTL
jgi:hypothetical protein